MKYVKLYKSPKGTPNNIIAGVFCVDHLENIEWNIQDAGPVEPGTQQAYFYQITGSYYGSSLDKDFELSISTLTEGDNVTLYPEEADRTKVMNFLVDSIVRACQSTYTTPGTSVVSCYPPFDVGASLVIDVNPFAPTEVMEEPGPGFGNEGMVPVQECPPFCE